MGSTRFLFSLILSPSPSLVLLLVSQNGKREKWRKRPERCCGMRGLKMEHEMVACRVNTGGKMEQGKREKNSICLTNAGSCYCSCHSTSDRSFPHLLLCLLHLSGFFVDFFLKISVLWKIYSNVVPAYSEYLDTSHLTTQLILFIYFFSCILIFVFFFRSDWWRRNTKRDERSKRTYQHRAASPSSIP